jgi:hypothetical protein
MRSLPPNFHTQEYGGAYQPPKLLWRPAYSLLPFLRAPVGYEIVRPFPVIIMTGWLIFGPPMIEFVYVGSMRARLPDNLGHEAMMEFAVLYCVLALGIFVRRLIGQRRREQVHSSEAGYSWLAWLTPLPVWLCEQILVPAAVVGAGYAISNSFSYELGLWLILSGISLFFVAHWESRRRWSQQRATVDDMIRAQMFEAQVNREEPQPAGRTSPEADKPDIAELGGGNKWTG